jgi:hypothetical protein
LPSARGDGDDIGGKGVVERNDRDFFGKGEIKGLGALPQAVCPCSLYIYK